MRPIIQKLSKEMINLISAGEVIERPASVVKELVENSIDAKSDKIIVELIDGGIKKIIVTDNGIGMTSTEIPLALEPHATSKIKNSDDLFHIATLGFRGEALPSIAGISKFKISSITNLDERGYYYQYENGQLVDEGTSAIARGTSIEVEDLFYNTPARFKHLSSVYSENAHIQDFLYKSALANPNISFTLINNGKTVYQTTPSNDLTEIIAKTYGVEVAKSMLYFEDNNDLYHLSGYTSSNQVFRSNKNALTVLVNNRLIRNQNLIYAILDAYKSIIPIGKYPVTILKITCDPSVIDVNVHPSKLEIRFTDEYALRFLITKTIQKTLSNALLVVQNPYQPVVEENEKMVLKEEVQKEKEVSLDDLWDDFETVEEENIKEEKEEKISFEKELPKQTTLFAKNIQDNERFFFRKFRYIGQFNKTYLLFEEQDNLYLIDQHAAAERINYEKISESFKNIQMFNISQYELLVPIIVDFSVTDIPLINQQLESFNKYGLEIESFGGTSYKVTKIPTWIVRGTEKESILEMIELIIHHQKASPDVLFDEIAKQMSCKKSIKANMRILDEEVNSLLTQLDKCNMPFTCPHGRPTLIKFTTYELEKSFKRVI